MPHLNARSKKQRIRLTMETLESRECLSAYSIIDLLPPVGKPDTSVALGLNDLGLVAGRTLLRDMAEQPRGRLRQAPPLLARSCRSWAAAWPPMPRDMSTTAA